MSKLIRRRTTRFTELIKFDGETMWVSGTYFYAPDELYGDYPVMFTQDDSELHIEELLTFNGHSCIEDLEDEEIRKGIEDLVWEKLLSDN